MNLVLREHSNGLDPGYVTALVTTLLNGTGRLELGCLFSYKKARLAARYVNPLHGHRPVCITIKKLSLISYNSKTTNVR